MLNIVLDTNVLVAALRSRLGASNKVVSLIETAMFKIHLSVPLVVQYEDVLKRPKYCGEYTEAEIDEIIDELCYWGAKHEIWYLWRPMLSDANDEFVAELAVTAQADYIITFNLKDFKGMEKFGIKAINPSEFLHILGKHQ
jgi:putative PIN family toxin of toxin-antitoxin system